MRFLNKKKIALALSLCSVFGTKSSAMSDLSNEVQIKKAVQIPSTRNQKVVGLATLNLLGLSALSVGGYKTYKFFNPDKKFDKYDDKYKGTPLTTDDEYNKKNAINDDKYKEYYKFFSSDNTFGKINKALHYKNNVEVKKKIAEGTIKNYNDLKEVIEGIAYEIYSSNNFRAICREWCNDILKKLRDNKNNLKKVTDGYIFVDENNKQFDQIKKNLPDIFVAALKLNKKIVPVFKIINKEEKNQKSVNAKLYFACEDDIESYLVESYKIYDTDTSDFELIQKINNNFD